MITIIICEVLVNVKNLTIHRCQDNDSIDLGAFSWNRRRIGCCCCAYDDDDDDDDDMVDDDIISVLVLLKLVIIVRLVGSVVDVDVDTNRWRRSVFVLLLLFNISSPALLLFSFFMVVACIVLLRLAIVGFVFRRLPPSLRLFSLTHADWIFLCLSTCSWLY
jgi:hypothetical protein